MKLFFLSFFILTSQILVASEKTNLPFVFDLKLVGNELVMHIEDTDPVANMCDYYVRRMEYSPALKAMTIDLALEPCFSDQYGKRHAELKWLLPFSLRSNSQFTLVVGEKKIGEVIISGLTARIQ